MSYWVIGIFSLGWIAAGALVYFLYQKRAELTELRHVNTRNRQTIDQIFKDRRELVAELESLKSKKRGRAAKTKK